MSSRALALLIASSLTACGGSPSSRAALGSPRHIEHRDDEPIALATASPPPIEQAVDASDAAAPAPRSRFDVLGGSVIGDRLLVHRASRPPHAGLSLLEHDGALIAEGVPDATLWGVSADGSLLAAMQGAGSIDAPRVSGVVLLSLPGFEELGRWSHEGAGEVIVVHNWGWVARRFDLERGRRRLGRVEDMDPILAVADASGETVWIAGPDGAPRRWDLARGDWVDAPDPLEMLDGDGDEHEVASRAPSELLFRPPGRTRLR